MTNVDQIIQFTDPIFRLLDNPVWHALKTVHSGFAIGNRHILRYPSDVLPFLGLEKDEQEILGKAGAFFKDGEEAFVKDLNIEIPQPWTVLKPVPCNQMVYAGEIPFKIPGGPEVTKLSKAEGVELFDLVNLIQPGFFEPQTRCLGDYYGIRVRGKLVAVAGERLKIEGFTEISAVCTHPDHTGNGYAQKLLLVLCAKIVAEGNVPFLHVINGNTRAISIYERLGFRCRMNFPLVKLKYNGYKFKL